MHAAACKNTEKGESPVYIFVSGAFLLPFLSTGIQLRGLMGGQKAKIKMFHNLKIRKTLK